MTAARDDQNKNEKKSTVTEQINQFFQKHRKVLLIGFLSAVLILAGLIIGITVRDKIQAKNLSKVDGFNRRYLELKNSQNFEDSEAAAKQIDIVVLLVELDDFAKKSSGFPAARAFSISGDILADQKNWANAEEAYLNAAKAAGKSYFAPLNFFNAAVAAEERGDIDSAVVHYQKALDFGNIFPAAARAMFSIGRLEESRNNKLAAMASYSLVMAKWPEEQLWANLAQSRMIALSE